MKKISFILAFMGLALFANAQQNRISVGYGVLSNDQLISGFSTVLGNAFVGQNVDDIRSTGAIALTYHRVAEGQRFSYGASFVFDNLKANVKDNNSGDKTDEQKTNAYTVALETRYNYNKGQRFQIYGLLGAGYTFSNTNYEKNAETTSDNHFNFQVTPIGFAYGGPLKGFLELGVGYKGLASAGIAYSF